MSTTVQCAARGGIVEIGTLSGYTEPRMFVRVDDNLGRQHLANPTRAEFLAAVATELNVIVIDRTDLPEVTVSPDGRIQARGATLHNGTATGDDALGWLAIDEHLKAHPPIDEAAVDALQRALADLSLDNRLAKADVRALVAAGVRAPQAGDDQ